VRPVEGTKRYLRLFAPARSILLGVAWGVATLAGLLALGLLLDRLHVDQSSQQAEDILKAVTPGLAIALALGAGFAEEVFFRGLLQKRLGWVGQAVVFGLFHLSYGTWLQVLVPFALGLLYGWIIKRGGSLWTTMAAHFVYDATQLLLAVYAKGL